MAVLRPFLIPLVLAVMAMPSIAGDFFPPEYKTFPYQEGDLLAGLGRNGKYSISKVLKIDKVVLKAGDPISIQGQVFHATEDDFLLVISCSIGEAEFSSLEEAKTAARNGAWTVSVAQAPNRAPGAAEGQTLIGHQPVAETELAGYKQWKAAFDRHKAGIF